MKVFNSLSRRILAATALALFAAKPRRLWFSPCKPAPAA